MASEASLKARRGCLQTHVRHSAVGQLMSESCRQPQHRWRSDELPGDVVLLT